MLAKTCTPSAHCSAGSILASSSGGAHLWGSWDLLGCHLACTAVPAPSHAGSSRADTILAACQKALSFSSSSTVQSVAAELYLNLCRHLQRLACVANLWHPRLLARCTPVSETLNCKAASSRQAGTFLLGNASALSHSVFAIEVCRVDTDSLQVSTLSVFIKYDTAGSTVVLPCHALGWPYTNTSTSFMGLFSAEVRRTRTRIWPHKFLSLCLSCLAAPSVVADVCCYFVASKTQQP